MKSPAASAVSAPLLDEDFARKAKEMAYSARMAERAATPPETEDQAFQRRRQEAIDATPTR